MEIISNGMTLEQIETKLQEIKSSIGDKFKKGIKNGRFICRVEKEWKGSKSSLKQFLKKNTQETNYYLESWKKIYRWWNTLEKDVKKFLAKSGIQFWSTSALVEVSKNSPSDIQTLEMLFGDGSQKTSFVKKFFNTVSRKKQFSRNDWIKIKEKHNFSEEQIAILKNKSLDVAVNNGQKKIDSSHVKIALSTLKNNKVKNADFLLKKILEAYDESLGESLCKPLSDVIKDTKIQIKEDSYLFSVLSSETDVDQNSSREDVASIEKENKKLKKENSQLKDVISSLEESLLKLEKIGESDIVASLKRKIEEMQVEILKKQELINSQKEIKNVEKNSFKDKIEGVKTEYDNRISKLEYKLKKQERESLKEAYQLKEENSILQEALRNANKKPVQGINSSISKEIDTATFLKNKETLNDLKGKSSIYGTLKELESEDSIPIVPPVILEESEDSIPIVPPVILEESEDCISLGKEGEDTDTPYLDIDGNFEDVFFEILEEDEIFSKENREKDFLSVMLSKM